MQIYAPIIDLEVRGVPALTYFGNLVWKDVFEGMNAGGAWSAHAWGREPSQHVPTVCMAGCACAAGVGGPCRVQAWR